VAVVSPTSARQLGSRNPKEKLWRTPRAYATATRPLTPPPTTHHPTPGLPAPPAPPAPRDSHPDLGPSSDAVRSPAIGSSRYAVLCLPLMSSCARSLLALLAGPPRLYKYPSRSFTLFQRCNERYIVTHVDARCSCHFDF
jgi:hypothetical protein